MKFYFVDRAKARLTGKLVEFFFQILTNFDRGCFLGHTPHVNFDIILHVSGTWWLDRPW